MAAIAAHRALADESRARLLDELRHAHVGLDVQELARRVGLHENTVRWHLGILAGAGFVTSRPAARATPGRPRIVYAIEPGAPVVGDEYRLLAEILAGAVAGTGEASRRAEDAGRSWGHRLVELGTQPALRTSEQAVATVVELLDRHGFAPEPTEDGIRMRRCPFRELAETSPDVVCAAHRGLVEGALEELGSDLEVGGVDVARPGVCLLRLRRAAS